MTLHVERMGAGPDLVLLHGWAMHGGAWAAVAPRLAKRFRLHVVDLPGHGHSRGAAFKDLDSLAARVAEVVPAGSAAAGWSLGGLVAMRLATIATLGIRALGLVASTPSFVAREGWAAAIAPETVADFARGLARDRDATVRAFLHLTARGAAGARACVRRLEALVAERRPAEEAALTAGLDVLATSDLRGDAAVIRQPVAVIHGSLDELVPVEAGRLLATTLPNARLVEIPGAAHAPLLTHADAVASALERIDG